MENIKESLLMSMLENQCKIMAQYESIIKRLDALQIQRSPNVEMLLDQFKIIDSNIEKDKERLLKETYERAERYQRELSRDTNYYQEL